MSRDRLDPRYNNANYLGPTQREILRAADPLSNDTGDAEDPGLPFGYSPNQGFVLNPFNPVGPVYGTPAAPGQITTVQFTVTDRSFDAFFKVCVSTGPFLAAIRKGQQSYYNMPVHSSLIFGSAASNPGLWLRSLHANTNDIIYVDCYDISGALNYVWLLFDGVQKS
jgi:hypothetical protein